MDDSNASEDKNVTEMLAKTLTTELKDFPTPFWTRGL